MRYRVRYYYSEQGMEGRADERDYGVVEADSAAEAIETVVMNEYPDEIMYGPENAWWRHPAYVIRMSAI